MTCKQISQGSCLSTLHKSAGGLEGGDRWDVGGLALGVITGLRAGGKAVMTAKQRQ